MRSYPHCNSPYAGKQLVMESALDTAGGLHPAAIMPAASRAPETHRARIGTDMFILRPVSVWCGVGA